MAKDGSVDETIRSILEEIEPEAAYFSDIEGARSAYVVDTDDASRMLAMAQPFIVGPGAAIRIYPVKTQEDLGKAVPAVEHAAQTCG